MIVDSEKEVPKVFVVQAISATWLLLAGYLVFPATFASLKNSDILEKVGVVGHSIATLVEHVGLLYVASIVCIISTLWLLWLWFKLQSNYVWLTKHIFL